ncbi:hypothetical protein [Halomicrococcus sp. SG-WS-1]|uniref:hypothetical protein n=1 Tax=Halomicrococcus sp. SG-WS-1 TaxID=3439057 RepID=UPI003F7AE3C9
MGGNQNNTSTGRRVVAFSAIFCIIAVSGYIGFNPEVLIKVGLIGPVPSLDEAEDMEIKVKSQNHLAKYHCEPEARYLNPEDKFICKREEPGTEPDGEIKSNLRLDWKYKDRNIFPYTEEVDIVLYSKKDRITGIKTNHFSLTVPDEEDDFSIRVANYSENITEVGFRKRVLQGRTIPFPNRYHHTFSVKKQSKIEELKTERYREFILPIQLAMTLLMIAAVIIAAEEL